MVDHLNRDPTCVMLVRLFGDVWSTAAWDQPDTIRIHALRLRVFHAYALRSKHYWAKTYLPANLDLKTNLEHPANHLSDRKMIVDNGHQASCARL